MILEWDSENQTYKLNVKDKASWGLVRLPQKTADATAITTNVEGGHSQQLQIQNYYIAAAAAAAL